MSLITHRASEFRVAAASVGAVIWLDALLVRLLFHADETAVWMLGRKIPWVCSMRTVFGLPCPTCGMTRSMILSLQGEFRSAWQVAPGGLAATVGLLIFATALLAAAVAGWRGWFRPLGKAALVYGAGTMAVWLGGWIFHFTAALARR
jgi:hypothetical protein